MAVALGAKVLTTKAASNYLKGAIVDDAFIVGKVASDSELWSVYRSYITAAPLMQLAMTEVD